MKNIKKYLTPYLFFVITLLIIAIVGADKPFISGFAGFVAGLFFCVYLFSFEQK